MSDEDLDLLRCYAREREPGRWTFQSPEDEAENTARGVPPESLAPENALEIIRFCLTLGTQVTSVLTGSTMLRIAAKLADLDARVTRLENPPATGISYC